jgi:hypothetical protein
MSPHRTCRRCTHFFGTLLVEQTSCTSEMITHWAWPVTSRGLFVKYLWHVTVCYMFTLTPTGPTWLICIGFCFHIVWCNAKVVGNRAILKIYLNSMSKNTSETDLFPHGTKTLLNSVIILLYRIFKTHTSTHTHTHTHTHTQIQWYIRSRKQEKQWHFIYVGHGNQ